MTGLSGAGKTTIAMAAPSASGVKLDGDTIGILQEHRFQQGGQGKSPSGGSSNGQVDIQAHTSHLLVHNTV